FDHLVNLMASKNLKIVYLLVSQEDHQDHKGIHHHVFLQLDKDFETTNERFFDIQKHHPHFERVGHVDKYISYCKKEDKDFLEYGVPVFRRKYVRKNQKEEYKQLIYDEIDRLKKIYYEDENSILSKLRQQLDDFMEKTDRDFFYENICLINKIFKQHFKRKPLTEEMKKALELKKNRQSNFAWEQFKINNPKAQKIIQFVKTFDPIRAKSLVIESDSRYGKTQFILALLNKLSLRFNYIKKKFYFGRGAYDKNAPVCVFDDFSLFKIIKQGWLESVVGGQGGFYADAKYQPTRFIEKGTFNIFLCNKHNSFEKFCIDNKKLGRSEWKYIKENCYFIKLEKDEKFY
ncbi:MAG: hypothetical protein Q8763_02465, partial [Candidatus Phytoplasma australasiaticum]|nr:hypothetical protein [Candidatus Phytoplasma australasiaticum]